jgi:curved DNA-binding protein CbpA
MLKQNPFKVLGLSKEIVKNMTSEELRPLVEHMFRYFAVKNHPDHGGTTEKFQEINGANDLLKDPGSFEEYKENYTKSEKESKNSLAKLAASKEEGYEKILSQFRNYITTLGLGSDSKDRVSILEKEIALELRVFGGSTSHFVNNFRHLTDEEKKNAFSSSSDSSMINMYKKREQELCDKLEKYDSRISEGSKKARELRNKLASIRFDDGENVRDEKKKILSDMHKQDAKVDKLKKERAELQKEYRSLKNKLSEIRKPLLGKAREEKKQKLRSQFTARYMIQKGHLYKENEGKLVELPEFVVGGIPYDPFQSIGAKISMATRDSSDIQLLNTPNIVRKTDSFSLSKSMFKLIATALEPYLRKDYYLVTIDKDGEKFNIKGRIEKLTK